MMRSIKCLCGALVLAAVALPSARADIFDDILSIATAARDNAAAARNNAASARDRAIEARDNAANARDRATEARDNALNALNTAATARDTAIEMRDNMIAGVQLLTDDVRTAIADAVADLQQEISDQLAEADEFVNSGQAESFRQDLLTLLLHVEDLGNSLMVAAGADGVEMDLSKERLLIQNVPARLLYPLYLATQFEAPGLVAWANAALARATTDLNAISGLLLDAPAPVAGDMLDQEVARCAYVHDHLAELRDASSDLTKFSLGARALGTLLKAAGTTEIQKTGAVWGWAGVTVRNNRVKKLGTMIDGLGTAVGSLNSYVSAKTQYCVGIAIQDEARQRQNQILANQEEILLALKHSPISTRP